MLSFKLLSYYSREILTRFLGSLLLLFFFSIAIQVVRFSRVFSVYHVSFYEAALLMGCLTLTLLPLFVPLSFIFAVVLTLNRAHIENEMVGLKVSGHSTHTFWILVLVISAVLCSLGYLSYQRLIPQSFENFKKVIYEYQSRKIIGAVQEKKIFRSIPGLMIVAEQVKGAQLKKVTLMNKSKSHHSYIFSEEAQLMQNKKENKIEFLMKGGKLTSLGSSSHPVLLTFEKMTFAFPFVFTAPQKKIFNLKALTFNELRQRMQVLSPGLERDKHQLEYYGRLAMVFASLFFGFLGLVIGSLSFRGMRNFNLILCLFFVGGYWAFMALGELLVLNQYVSVWLGAWLANLFFFMTTVGIHIKERYI